MEEHTEDCFDFTEIAKHAVKHNLTIIITPCAQLSTLPKNPPLLFITADAYLVLREQDITLPPAA